MNNEEFETVIIFEIIKVKSDDRLIFCYVNCYIYQLPVSISSVILHEERKPKNNSSGENICGTIRSTKIFYMKIKKFLYAGNRSGNAGTGSENRNHGYGKCPEELSGTENTWKDSISGSGPSPGSAGRRCPCICKKLREPQGNLSKQIMAGGAGKYYLAVTEGVPGKQEGIFIDYLKKKRKSQHVSGSTGKYTWSKKSNSPL